MDTKTIIKLCILTGLGGWYTHYLYENPKGIKHQRILEAKNAQEQAAITALEEKISTLKTKTIAMQSNRFEREKIIREDLQMSCTNEYVYLLPQDART
jgi:cell division protein FtsB